MIRVLECGVSCVGGGIEKYVYTQYMEFDKSKVHVDFINIYKGQEMAYSDKIEALGSVVYDLTDNKAWNKFFREHHGEYDIIIFNTANPIFLPLWRAKSRGGFKKVIVHSHNSKHALPWYLKMFTPITDRYLKMKISLLQLGKWACSESAGHFMFRKKDQFEVIKNAMNISEFRFNPQKREEKRKEIEVSGSTKVVGIIGRIDKEKNIPFGIRGFSEFHKRNPDSKLIIIGGISHKNEIGNIERAIHIAGMENVKYLGLRLDAADWYNAFDAFLFPSKLEGFGLVGLEAQISGLPCIFSDRIPSSAIVSDLVSVLPIDETPGIYELWASEMEKIIAKDNDRSVRYQDAIRAGFDIQTETRRVEGLLESYCKG